MSWLIADTKTLQGICGENQNLEGIHSNKTLIQSFSKWLARFRVMFGTLQCGVKFTNESIRFDYCTIKFSNSKTIFQMKF